MANLMEGLIEEISRNKELLEGYKEVGPVGEFGFAGISADIKAAEAAMGSGDTVAMVRICKILQENN